MVLDRLVKCLVVLAVVVVFAGCSSGPEATPTPKKTGLSGGGVTGNPNEPAWVSQAGAAFPGDRGKAIYAIGDSMPDLNMSLTITRARERGRIEMARIIESSVTSMVKDFMESHKDYATSEQGSIEFTQIVGKNVAQAVLNGSRQVDTWTNQADKHLFVLMKVSVEDMAEAAKKKARALAEKKGVFIKAKADKAFADLDAQIEKALGQAAQ